MKILLLIIAAFVTSPCHAREFRFYGPDRVGSTLITAIAQDAEGLIWVGTERGIDRFDGYRFDHTASLDGTSRPTVVASLFADEGGALWVGTSRGLFRSDGTSPDGTLLFAPVLFPDSLQPRVTSLLRTPDGRLLAGTAGYGLFEIDTLAMEALRTPDFEQVKEDDYFNHLYLSPDGTMWKGGITDRISKLPRRGAGQTLSGGSGLPVGFFRRNGAIYALCQRGVMPLSPSAAGIGVPELPFHFICCAADGEGNIFAGTRGDGLYWLPVGEAAFRRLSVEVAGFDLDHARVETLFADRSGNLWAGCSGRGLLLVARRQAHPFASWSFAQQSHPTGSYISSLADGSGGIAAWAVVQGDGIYGFDTAGHIVAHPAAPDGVETFIRDAEGTYWLGTANQLWRYNPVAATATLAATLPGDRIAALADLGEHGIAASTFGDGVAIIDKLCRRPVRQLSMHDEASPHRHRLVNNWVNALDVDARGRLWIGTSSGVCRYDLCTDNFDADSLGQLIQNEACTALRVLASGDVLFATSQGLLRWSESEGLRQEIGTEPLAGHSVAYIVEDSHADIWLSTSGGIWLWQPAVQRISAQLSAAPGQGTEYVHGAGLLAADGSILFATAEAITRFHPDSLRNRRPLDAKIRRTAFSHEGAALTMEFSLMNFLATEGTVFEYRFSDEDSWNQLPPGENALTFNRLAPARYTLLVRASVGGQTTEPEAYDFEVPPPWWLTPWAFAVYLLMVVAAVAAAAWAYRRHLQHQMDREKLSFLISATGDEDSLLTLDELQTAITRYVQSRRQQTIQAAAQTRNVATMTEAIDEPQVCGNDEHLMQRITQSVNRHLGDSDFTVELMCDEVGISRAHLHRKMKELTGFSVTEFIRNIRLEQAARLLRERKLNITQVAYTVGFSNLGYFSTVFRKHFGISPRDYVEQQ